MKCPYCSADLPDGSNFCTQCGKTLNAAPQQQAPQQQAAAPQGEAKSRTLYIVLAIVLGEFGIHNFYSGHTTYGIIKLVVTIFTSGILVWAAWGWAIYEAITVKEDANGVPFK